MNITNNNRTSAGPYYAAVTSQIVVNFHSLADLEPRADTRKTLDEIISDTARSSIRSQSQQINPPSIYKRRYYNYTYDLGIAQSLLLVIMTLVSVTFFGNGTPQEQHKIKKEVIDQIAVLRKDTSRWDTLKSHFSAPYDKLMQRAFTTAKSLCSARSPEKREIPLVLRISFFVSTIFAVIGAMASIPFLKIAGISVSILTGCLIFTKLAITCYKEWKYVQELQDITRLLDKNLTDDIKPECYEQLNKIIKEIEQDVSNTKKSSHIYELRDLISRLQVDTLSGYTKNTIENLEQWINEFQYSEEGTRTKSEYIKKFKELAKTLAIEAGNRRDSLTPTPRNPKEENC